MQRANKEIWYGKFQNISNPNDNIIFLRQDEDGKPVDERKYRGMSGLLKLKLHIQGRDELCVLEKHGFENLWEIESKFKNIFWKT